MLNTASNIGLAGKVRSWRDFRRLEASSNHTSNSARELASSLRVRRCTALQLECLDQVKDEKTRMFSPCGIRSGQD